MQTKPKSNSIVTSAYDAARNVITFTVLDVGECELDLNKVAEANMRRAAVHGWNQRIPDAAAIGVADKEGNVIPRAERNRIKYERMNELCRHYESGSEEWSRRGPSIGGGAPEGLTLLAIMRVKGCALEVAEGFVKEHADMHHKGDTKAALAFLRTGRRVKEAMQAIKDERALAKAGPRAELDADAILGEMGSE